MRGGSGTVRGTGKIKAVLSVMILIGIVSLFSGLSGEAFGDVLYADLTDRASLEDRADLLSQEEEEDLLEAAGSLSKKTGFEIRLVTTGDAEGKSTRVYAEDYFESLTENGPGKAHGGCYIIDLDNREFYVATYGMLMYYLTDRRVDNLLDDAFDKVSEGDYYGALSVMLEDTEKYFRWGISDGTRIYDEETGSYTVYKAPKSVTFFKLLIAFLAGAAAFLSVFVPISALYGMKGKVKDGYSAKDSVHLSLTRKEDILKNRFVTQRRLPRNDGPKGGGSSSHTTTSHHTGGGYSAGGGGRKF